MNIADETSPTNVENKADDIPVDPPHCTQSIHTQPSCLKS